MTPTTKKNTFLLSYDTAKTTLKQNLFRNRNNTFLQKVHDPINMKYLCFDASNNHKDFQAPAAPAAEFQEDLPVLLQKRQPIPCLSDLCPDLKINLKTYPPEQTAVLFRSTQILPLSLQNLLKGILIFRIPFSSANNMQALLKTTRPPKL